MTRTHTSRPHTHLGDEELGDALCQAPSGGRQDHLEHVALELLHDDVDLLWRLEHLLQVHDARMVQVLKRNVVMLRRHVTSPT